MPDTSEKDIVEEAREMLRKTTPRPWMVVDKGEYDPRQARRLLQDLCDEVERLRMRILELETDTDTSRGYL